MLDWNDSLRITAEMPHPRIGEVFQNIRVISMTWLILQYPTDDNDNS